MKKSAVDLLPKKTYNCESFGLVFAIDGSGNFWWCKYYSHFSNKNDGRYAPQKGKTIEESAKNMLDYMNNLKQ